MKKLVSLVLALALCASLAVPALATEFTDVSADHPFHDAIMDCAGKGIVGGYSDGTFKPANTVTNSNFVVMLSRAFYADEVANYVAQGYQANGTFYPNYIAMQQAGATIRTSFEWDLQKANVMNKGITRYDMAQLMTNIMAEKGFAATESQKSAVISEIKDYSEIPSQYRDAVTNVYALGIIGGFSNGNFGGEVTMTRGQAAIVIYRLAQYVGDGSGAGPEPSEDPAGPISSDPAPEIPAVPEQGKPETPETPSTPVTPTDRTLSNGKAITEANVTEILNQLKATYPRGTDFGKGYAGLGSGRTPSKNCIAQITNQYWRAANHSQHTSTTTGCGGWAAFVADEIFGQTDVTWKKTSIANARPGDLMIILDDSGYLMHVDIYVSESTGGFPKTMEVYTTDATSGSNGVYSITWANNTYPSNHNVDVWTAYPD